MNDSSKLNCFKKLDLKNKMSENNISNNLPPTHTFELGDENFPSYDTVIENLTADGILDQNTQHISCAPHNHQINTFIENKENVGPFLIGDFTTSQFLSDKCATQSNRTEDNLPQYVPPISYQIVQMGALVNKENVQPSESYHSRNPHLSVYKRKSQQLTAENEFPARSVLPMGEKVQTNDIIQSDSSLQIVKIPDFKEQCSIYNGERNHDCETCDKRFVLEHDLQKHTTIHAEEKMDTCKPCRKTFVSKGNLKHLITHTVEKPFKCNACGKCFAQKASLSNHEVIHTGEGPHVCKIYGKGFTRKWFLDCHTVTHTKERQYKCEICGKTFSKKSHLSRHKLTHTGEKPHKCETCDKTFSQKSHLTRHKLTHTGEKPHKCEICDKSFTRKQQLSQHKCTTKETFLMQNW